MTPVTPATSSRWRWLSHVASGRGHAFERLTAGEVRVSACGCVVDRDCPQLAVTQDSRAVRPCLLCVRSVRAAEARPAPETQVS